MAGSGRLSNCRAAGACAGRLMWSRSSSSDSRGAGRLRRPARTGLGFVKQQLEELLLAALASMGDTFASAPRRDAVVVERTRDAQHGDFATNVALRLAKPARRNPRDLAQAIVAALPASALVARAEVAGAGF